MRVYVNSVNSFEHAVKTSTKLFVNFHVYTLVLYLSYYFNLYSRLHVKLV